MTDQRTSRNEAIVREIYDAALRLDMSVLEGHLAPGVRLVEPAGHPVGRTLWEGRAEFMAGLREVFALLRISRLVFHDVLAGPNRVAGVLDVVSTDENGNDTVIPLVEVFTFDNGMITEIRPYYFDVSELRESNPRPTHSSARLSDGTLSAKSPLPGNSGLGAAS